MLSWTWPKSSFLPHRLQRRLRIGVAELRGHGREFLRVHEQHFAAAIVALHLRVGGESAAMRLDVEFIIHDGKPALGGSALMVSK